MLKKKLLLWAQYEPLLNEIIFVGVLHSSLTMANESLCAKVEPKHGGHVEWGASLDVLDVGVSP